MKIKILSLGLGIFCFLSLCNYAILIKIQNSELGLRRIVSRSLFDSSVDNMQELEKRFPTNPNKGEWARVPTQDTHWLTLPVDNAQGMLDKILKFADEHKGEYTDVVVIGMGGSSRPADVIKRVLGKKEEGARIHVMENLDEADIAKIRDEIEIENTLFISISKSGTTAETMALTKIAYEWIQKEGLEPSRHFIAITTPPLSLLSVQIKKGKISLTADQQKELILKLNNTLGGSSVLSELLSRIDNQGALSNQELAEGLEELEVGFEEYAQVSDILRSSLEEFGVEKKVIGKIVPPLLEFLADKKVSGESIFQHPEQVGGRYTLFSVIGMLPAALAGHNVTQILSLARSAMEAQLKYQLGKFLHEMESQGRIYMRVVLPSELEGLGPWIEQLLAESLGKIDGSGRNRGIVPILERDFDPEIYTEKTFAFRIKFGQSDERDDFMSKVKDKGVPIWEMKVNTSEEAVGSLYLLEFATGMAGILMGIDPFDQPGVEAGKQSTLEIKAKIQERIKSGASLEQAYREAFQAQQSPYRVEIADGITLDFGELVRVTGGSEGEFLEFVKEKEGSLVGLSAEGIYSLALKFAVSKDKSYGAILPYAQETKERAEVWAIARGVQRKFGLQDIYGIGPVYEHSLRQYLQQGPDVGIPTFIVVNDIGNQVIPGDPIDGFTSGMQNALQALGTQKALADVGRYTLRIEIEGPLTPDKLSTLREFFSRI